MRQSLKERMQASLTHHHHPDKLKKRMKGVKKITSKFYQDLIEIKKEKKKWIQTHHPLFLSIGLCISLLFVNAAFIWETEKTKPILEYSELQGNTNEVMDIPISKQPPPPPPKKMVELFVIKEVEEEVMDEIEINLDVEISEESEIEEVVYEEVVEEERVDEVFSIVESMPSPYGGISAFYDYVNENINYPKPALRMEISGRVFVKFIVEKDGSISGINVVKGIGAGCDQEAIRVLSQAPKWEPGKQRGRPVRVSMILPIAFVMSE